MGKAKSKRNNSSASAGPYSRPQKNNIFKFNKEWGQHVLKNPGVADAIVAKAGLQPTDVVLEIGPGTGNLSVRILQKARKLTAIELDPRMAAELTKRVQGSPEQKKLDILLGDCIKMDLPPHDVLITNTPYQISSPLIFKILAMPNPPRMCILMLQREFAQRLVARPGDKLYCRLSVNAQFFAKIAHILKVSKANFNPPPQVESSVVRIEPKSGRDKPSIAFSEFDGLTRIIFSRRNKTIRASFFGSKETLGMIERNYRTWASLNSLPLEDGYLDDNGETEADEEMADGDEDPQDDEDQEEGLGMDLDGDDVPDFFKELTSAGQGEGQSVVRTPSRRRKTKVGELVRKKVAMVLEVTGLAESRASKCDEGDFLKLLYEFNKEGIHFA